MHWQALQEADDCQARLFKLLDHAMQTICVTSNCYDNPVCSAGECTTEKTAARRHRTHVSWWEDHMQIWPYHCMPSASITSNISQSLDVQCIESAQISFNSVFVNLLTKSSELFLTKFPCPFVFYTLQGLLADVLA